MSKKLTVCGVCEYRYINKPSLIWCSECDEGLCEECEEHHAASKGTRNHSIVPILDYMKLPWNIFENTQTCPKHDEKYQIFCRKHDIPCCRRCVTETHNDCKEIDVIDDVIKNVKSSNAFLEIEHMLTELSENLHRMRKDRQENIKSLMENRAKIEKEVQQTRILIDNKLDKLQESLIKELYAAEKKESTEIKNIIASIQETERNVSEKQTTFDKIKQYASDLQTFCVLKHIQQDVRKNEQFIETLIKREKINHVSMSWKKEIYVEILQTTMKKMGTIILDTSSVKIPFINRKQKQAQIMMPIAHVPTIDNIRLTLTQTLKTNGRDVTGCSLLSDGRMIFSCYESYKIYVTKTDGTLDFTLNPGTKTSHVHCIEESQKLVITTGHLQSHIMYFDLKRRKFEKSINVGSENYGIVHKDGKLFYNGGFRGVCVVSLKDDSATQLVKDILSSFTCIAIWSNYIYFIDFNHSVTCCYLKGGIKWKLTLHAFLRKPRGLTVDNYGRVYVSGYASNNIVMISTDGKKHRILLSQKDGLYKPQSLCFDRKYNKLLVANQQDDAFLYDVSK